MSLLAATVPILSLACTLQGVADGDRYVGPEFSVAITATAHEITRLEIAELTVAGAEELGIADRWNTTPDFHGSVALEPADPTSTLTGLLIPHSDEDSFAVFWADSSQLKDSGAPTTIVSGHCETAQIEIGDAQ